MTWRRRGRWRRGWWGCDRSTRFREEASLGGADLAHERWLYAQAEPSPQPSPTRTWEREIDGRRARALKSGGVEGVDAALELVLAGPAAGAGVNVGAELNGLGAAQGVAADRGVALVHEGVVGEIVLLHVEADLLAGPVEHWGDGVAAVARGPFDEAGRGAQVGALGAADAAEPGAGLELVHRAFHGFDLVGGAAGVDVLAERVVVLAGGVEVGEGVVAGAVGPDVEVEAPAQVFHELVGLGEEVAGVDEDDPDVGLGLGGEVNEDGGLGAEGGSHDELVAELGGGPLDDVRRGFLLEHRVQRVHFDRAGLFDCDSSTHN